MATLFIKCPVTGKPVKTGMNVPENMDLNVFVAFKVNCKECDGTHVWNGQEAFFLNETNFQLVNV